MIDLKKLMENNGFLEYLEYYINNNEISIENYNFICCNPNLTINLIKKYPNKPWNYKLFCTNPNITIKDILENDDFPWDFNFLPLYKTIGIENILNNLHLPWSFYVMSELENVPINFIEKNYLSPWNWQSICELNKNLTICFIKKMIQLNIKLCYSSLIQNPVFTIEDIENNKDIPWDYSKICLNPNTTWIVIKNYYNNNDIINNMLISLNKNITPEIVDLNTNIKWRYSFLTNNKNFTFDYILKNKFRAWDFNALTRRSDITVETIINNQQFMWNNHTLLMRITEEEIKKYKFKIFNFEMFDLTRNKNISIEYLLNYEFKDLQFSYTILENPNLTIPIIKRHLQHFLNEDNQEHKELVFYHIIQNPMNQPLLFNSIKRQINRTLIFKQELIEKTYNMFF